MYNQTFERFRQGQPDKVPVVKKHPLEVQE
jgi:hypothetical protein